MNRMMIAKELRYISSLITAKKPKTLFDTATKEVKNEVKEILNQKMIQLSQKLADKLTSDLTEQGYTVVEPITSSLGKFKGHPYISNMKIKIQKDGVDWNNVLNVLNTTYSHKFKLKSVDEENNTAYFAMR